MSRPPPRSHATGPSDRVVVSGARGSRVIGDPFGSDSLAAPNASSSMAQINAYGTSVTAAGRTSGALLSRQQQEAMQSREAAGMLLDALEKYGPAPGARAMLDWEKSAATNAISAGVYVSWRSRRKGTDCTRVGPDSLCFCGHGYPEHGGPKMDGWKKNRMSCASCPCTNFNFIPRRPEECGEWWLPRRKEFDVRTYKAKCKCKHAHSDHDPTKQHSCRLCGCGSFNSAFLCVVCDCHSEEHDTVWETASERVESGRPVGEDYMPFAEAPEIRKLVFDRKPNQLVARPGEKPTRATAVGARARTPSRTRTKVASSEIGLPDETSIVPSSRPTRSSAPAAATSSSSTAARPALRSSSLSRRPPSSSSSAAASSTASLERRFASQSLSVDPADDPFIASAPPPRSSVRAPSAGRSRAPIAIGPVRALPTATAAAPAMNARAQRQAFEAQLASSVKTTSSGFKPVFD